MQVSEEVAPPNAENVPFGQAWQAVEESAKSVVEYVPALQSRQVDDPEPMLYFPVSHWTHEVEPKLDEYIPLEHA